MLDELLSLSKSTEVVCDTTVDGTTSNVDNYDCDP